MQEKLITLQDPHMNKKAKREIVLVSGILGLCILAFYYGGAVLTEQALQYTKTHTYTFNLWCSIQMGYSLVAIAFPFLIGALIIRKVQKRTRLIPWNQPEDKPLLVFSIAVGFLALIMANVLTTIFVGALGKHGITFDNADVPMPSRLSEYVFILFATVLVPAFTEEFVFRGVVLQSMRRYGDVFAVGISALLFACLHGNMTQMPFALLLGVVMGVLVIYTGSIWTGIFLHIFNNTYALVLSLINENCAMETAFSAVVVVDTIGVALGLLAIAWVVNGYKNKGTHHLYAPGGETKPEQRKFFFQSCFYTFVSLPMLYALSLLIYNLVKSVHLK